MGLRCIGSSGARSTEITPGSLSAARLRFVPTLRIDFLADIPPLQALAQFVDIATPVLGVFGFEPEARGGGWAHWAVEPFGGNVIRAYAFETAVSRGVSVTGDGNVPGPLVEQLRADVVKATGWILD